MPFRPLAANTTGSPFSHRGPTSGSLVTSLVGQHMNTIKLRLTIQGWLTVIGWIAALTSVCYFVADLVLQLVSLNDLDHSFVRTNWHGTLLLWAVLLLCVFINIFISGALPTIEVVVLVVHVLGFFGILVPMVYLSGSYNSAKVVFTTFNNNGGWSTQALAFFIGMQGNALAFVGTDSVVHVSKRPSRKDSQLMYADVGRSQKCKQRRTQIHASKSIDQWVFGDWHALCGALQCTRHPAVARRHNCVHFSIHPDLLFRGRIRRRCNRHGQHHHLSRVLQCHGMPSCRITHDLVLRSRRRTPLLAISAKGTPAISNHEVP